MENSCLALMIRAVQRPPQLRCNVGRGRWIRPTPSWTKVNTDGARNQTTRFTTCGRVLRSHEGEWKMGFTKFIGIFSVLEVEFWGVYMGLLRAWELQKTQIILEIDSLEALKAIEAAGEDGNMITLMNYIVAMLRRDWTAHLQYGSLNGNKVTNLMAEIENDNTHDCVKFPAPR
ncbi:hypothetical protein F3Y22_tig00110328pilonHSYRG00799 [Hibiscus syriacus]|uniref:RNase H type-1 domain-containing protein n=1 Tax=Hibiscus syriacus TaxID=106335 RepID=A0A6A3B3P4_HIBSY|nr:hypothetical protein F3Y22_tig00110328pilonHSYRG00799 [Hibiscus syriacus]